MEVLVAMGLFYMGYKFRHDTAKEEISREIYSEEIKQTETALKKTEVALEQTEKKYIELTIRMTRTQIITGAIGVGLVVAAYGAYIAYQRKRIAEERAEQILNMDNAWQCVVCADNEKTVVYLPCNHLAVCTKCDAEISEMNLMERVNEHETCPICRSQIIKRVTVHVQ